MPLSAIGVDGCFWNAGILNIHRIFGKGSLSLPDSSDSSKARRRVTGPRVIKLFLVFTVSICILCIQLVVLLCVCSCGECSTRFHLVSSRSPATSRLWSNPLLCFLPATGSYQCTSTVRSLGFSIDDNQREWGQAGKTRAMRGPRSFHSEANHALLVGRCFCFDSSTM